MSRRVVYEVNEVDKLDSYNNQLLLVLYWVMVLCLFNYIIFFKNYVQRAKK